MRRAVLIFTAFTLLAGGVLSTPAPLVTMAQGVVWPGERARVVNAVEGFVVDVVPYDVPAAVGPVWVAAILAAPGAAATDWEVLDRIVRLADSDDMRNRVRSLRAQRDLEALLGRPLRFANDADCFALSEATDGSAAGARVVFGVIVGTGTGGGIVVDGRLAEQV